MVAASRKLLKLVRRQTIRDELRAMRLRSRLVVPTAEKAGPDGRPATPG